MKQLPIGVSDFRDLIVGNYYFIDKSAFIQEIVRDGAKVKLFTNLGIAFYGKKLKVKVK